MTGDREARAAMVTAAEEHDIVDTAWRDAMLAVPRHLFLPDQAWITDPGDECKHIQVDRVADPGAWLTAAYRDDAVVTQLEDGGTAPLSGQWQTPTSSASAPSIVLSMLYDLAVRDGNTILEIGTGTGWNAALLAYRVGAERVVTVELDPGIAETARGTLKRAGYDPLVVTGDGAVGWPDAAPYDRVIVTCAVEQVPYAWVEQTRTGGLIVAPWRAANGHQAIVRLVKTGDGRAVGYFTKLASFMSLRSQRRAETPHELPDPFPGGARQGVTRLRREQVFTGRFDPFAFAAGLRLDAFDWRTAREDDGSPQVWLYDPAGTSWAVAALRDLGDADNPVYQDGPRSLWDEVEDAYRWWVAQGEPAVWRFGLSVAVDGARVWLDEPGSAVR